LFHRKLGEEKMKRDIGNSKQKRQIITIAIVLMMSASVLFAAVPFISAQTTATSIPSNTYIVVSPNPAGIGNTPTLQRSLRKVM